MNHRAVLPHKSTAQTTPRTASLTDTTITKLLTMMNRDTRTCVVLTTSKGPLTQRANVSPSLYMLHDLGVDFREIATAETPLYQVHSYPRTSNILIVHLQVFVELPKTRH
jgi:hypothetical protein